uniref:Uncharacterized protein n=1 Tax=Rhizophora mucronata TaxID=61149 RepID=A0A2P2PF76_RHIMU
MKNSKKERGFL